MKKISSLAFLLLCSFIAFCQNEFLIESSNKGFYINHKVAPKENYYSIGRAFKISPKEIEAFNGLNMSKGLEIGQTIKIPLKATNFSQTTPIGKPVYYVVGQKEGLYRVSLKNNNVLMANLRKWNQLSSDKISPGQKLIVGYLVADGVNEMGQKNPETEIKPTFEEKKPEEKKETVTVKQEKPFREEPVSEQKNKEVISPEPIKQTNNAVEGSGGYFKPQFDLQIKTQPARNNITASAGIFKTASGWQDGKYYALMDGVEPGTIIKVINPTNSKAIYAKVLGEMSGIRQNQGYDVRISNAAAAALEVSDTEKFIVQVLY